MNRFKYFGIILITGIALAFGPEIGERPLVPGTQYLLATAEARVGRPLTPVSVAGVARRSVRRCAAGVYNCELPKPQPLDNLIVQR